MPTDNKAIYASRGIHSILRVLYFPLPCVQADKSTAGLKPRPGAYSRDVSGHPIKRPCQNSTDRQMNRQANAQKNKRGATNRTKLTLLQHICFFPTAQSQTN